jgi:hypothetical protein
MFHAVSRKSGAGEKEKMGFGCKHEKGRKPFMREMNW